MVIINRPSGVTRGLAIPARLPLIMSFRCIRDRDLARAPHNTPCSLARSPDNEGNNNNKPDKIKRVQAAIPGGHKWYRTPGGKPSDLTVPATQTPAAGLRSGS